MQLLLPPDVRARRPVRRARHHRASAARPFEALLADIVAWFNAPLPTDDTPEPVADDLRQRIADMQPGPDELAAWDGVLLERAWRLKQVVDVSAGLPHAACDHHAGERQLDAALPPLAPRRHGTVFRPRHAALLGGIGGGAIFVSMCIWIASGWNDGAGAVTLAAVAVCFFAALDEPAPQVFTFFVYTCLSVVLAGLYLFVILPTGMISRCSCCSSPCRSS